MGCISTPKLRGFRGYTLMGMPYSGGDWVYATCNAFVALKYGNKFTPPGRYFGYRDPERQSAVATYRDPRDALIAALKKHLNGETAEQVFVNVFNRDVEYKGMYSIKPCIVDPRITAIRYEDFFPDKLSPLSCLLSGKMGIEVPQEMRDTLLENLAAANLIDDGRIGAWRTELTPRMLEVSRWFLEPAVIELGYETNNKWMEVVWKS